MTLSLDTALNMESFSSKEIIIASLFAPASHVTDIYVSSTKLAPNRPAPSHSEAPATLVINALSFGWLSP